MCNVFPMFICVPSQATSPSMYSLSLYQINLLEGKVSVISTSSNHTLIIKVAFQLVYPSLTKESATSSTKCFNPIT